MVGGWLVAIALAFGAALGLLGTPGLFERVHSGDVSAPGENQTGLEVLGESGARGFRTYTLLLQGVDIEDRAVARAGTAAVRELRRIEHVADAANPVAVRGGPRSPAGWSMLAQGGPQPGFATVVTFDADLTREQQTRAREQVDDVFDDLVTATGATGSERGGVRGLVDGIIDQVKKDGQRGEGIALPVSFLVMIVVFGGLIAAGIPLLGAIASIGAALATLLGLSYLLDLDATVVNVVTVLGLGLCIDYGLLVVSRFREQLRAVHPASGADLAADQIVAATGATLDRAGRTVVFSALTVAISLLGLSVFDIAFIRAVSAAGVAIVLLAMSVALSLIPALCALAARRLLRKATEVAADVGIFSRLAQAVHRIPWVVITVVTVLLVLLALPVLHLRLTSSAEAMLPRGAPERTFFETLGRHYPALAGPELTVVTRAPVEQVTAFADALANRPGVGSVLPPVERADGVVILGISTSDGPTGRAARQVAAGLRADRPPFEAWTVGQASALEDYLATVREGAPLAIGFVVLATLVLLFLMTGSIVIPVKALVMNVLSLGATLGIVVFIFQKGNFAGILDFSPVGAIENTIPVLLLAFGFGLSMDYEVFLLSRIVELHEQGHDTQSAVTLGLQRSGRIITSAALLMMIVFAGFAAAQLLTMKEMGVALVVAVALDATIVRMLLVPATMSVLGQANWWAPGPLRRFHERWGVRE
ncbi:MAG: MMPL family transporter [Tetrasphaera sp.]